MPIASPTIAAAQVLVADDSVLVQRTISAILRKHGHGGVLVSDGQAALDCLAQRPFDVVMLDISMPKLDGLQALAAIRQHEQVHAPARRQRVIMVTGHAEPGDMEKLLRAGADGYVAKPVQPQAFLTELQRVLQLQARAGAGLPRPAPAATVRSGPPCM